MIVNTDTVVEPRAVVVESFDATVADGTVLRADSSDHFAFGAHLAGMHLFQHFHEGDFGVGPQVAGVPS